MLQYPKEFEKNITLTDGTHIFLRPELSTDTEMLWQMFSTLSQDSLRYLVLPFTRDRIEKWTGKINYGKVLPILAVYRESNRTRVVANASLIFNEADSERHKAEFGLTVHDDFQNKGLGTIMTKRMIEIAREKKLKKVSLTVVTENDRAIRVYEKCGFKIEAKLEKENLVDGKFYDDYIMSIFL
jgi:RimJ/RimL family protein N-acetyltransferase